MDSGVTRIPVEFGTLFMPKGPGPFPAVISMYGGVHRGQVVEERSALLASRGFASLALPYFGVGNLPKTYLELGKPQNIFLLFSIFRHIVYQYSSIFEFHA